ncbi:MAG: ribosome-associated translation inhibitor RaiA [Candidatus Nealsonbacteria bacterium]|nr:ribosome-associated translation inhibitor RaiA [Candidatus Nealsonbacteria bacterium]
MNIDLKTKNINLDPPLRNFCQRVIVDLEKYIRISKTVPNGWMEIGKTTLHHKKGPHFRAECQIFLPGRSLRAEATARYLREAITQVKDKMQRQLKKYKEKI